MQQWLWINIFVINLSFSSDFRGGVRFSDITFLDRNAVLGSTKYVDPEITHQNQSMCLLRACSLMVRP